MLYLLIALCSHSQLERLRGDCLPGIEEGLRALLARSHARVVWRAQGITLAACGGDARPVASLALDALESLRARRADLFGFSLLLDELPQAPDERAARRLADAVLSLEPEEHLWVAPRAAARFDGLLESRPAVGFLRVLGPGAVPAAGGSASGDEVRPWTRETLVERCLELLSRRLNDSESRAVLLLHGPNGAGKTFLLSEAARRLGCVGPAAPLRAYALFRRRTPLHPFLNSVDAGFLAEVPALLAPYERRVWDELGGIMAGIVRAGSQITVPDRAVTDFFLAYRLYARARARRAARALVPAIVAFEDVESWHPAAREAATELIDDLLAEPSVIPVVTSTAEALPPEFAGIETSPLPVLPLGRREIRSFAQARFPGLELPEAVVRRIRSRSGGLPVAVMSALRYLERAGSIRGEDHRHVWVQGSGAAADLPADPLAVPWELIRSLPDDSFLLLHALFLAAGLLDRHGLLEFLAAAGFDRHEADATFADLIAAGVVVEEDCLLPRYPALRRRLEGRLGSEGGRLAERLADHLVRLWEQGEFHREVLLFSFLAHAGRTADAVRVLPGIVRRKLDEKDLAGARVFSDPSRLGFTRPPDEAGRVALSVTCTAGRLRAAVIDERLDEAGSIVRELARLTHADAGRALAAEAGLAAARYYLAAGDSASAMDALKRGLAAAQDAGAEGGPAVREASLLLGATMLADGRLGEAVEYAGLASREAQEAGDRLGALRAGSLLACGHFLEGRLTRAGECAGEARLLAAAMGQRDEEAFLCFLSSRIRFLLGDYEGCSILLQTCRCLVRLYGIPGAEPVLDAWIARALVHAGDAAGGGARLERLEASREVLLFQAEAALFGNDLAAAAEAVERGLAVPAATVFPPPHGGCWRDGFLALEGRCFSLGRSGTYLQRQLAALRGHLLARRGSAADGIRELGELVHGVRPADNDPNLHLYLFLYADALPEEAGDEDKVTVLAKALKGLQERASRIEAPAERTAFLRANRWNRAILEEARSRRLA